MIIIAVLMRFEKKKETYFDGRLSLFFLVSFRDYRRPWIATGSTARVSGAPGQSHGDPGPGRVLHLRRQQPGPVSGKSDFQL